MTRSRFLFPAWTNRLLPALGLTAVAVPLYAIYMVAYGFSPWTTDVGYQPEQPVPYSHELHAGKLGIDCRYCHNTVEYAAKAAVPPTQTCMNCHTNIHKESPNLKLVRESHDSGKPILWKRVHDLPDYAYFNHAAHVERGVSCVSCHGRVDREPTVFQSQPLSMSWCLECHRNPAANVRDPRDVTKLDWGVDMSAPARDAIAARYGLKPSSAPTLTLDERTKVGQFWLKQNNLNPPQDCTTCHR